jgi:hypothetical protein
MRKLNLVGLILLMALLFANTSFSMVVAGRELLASDRGYCVSTSGNDSNDGSDCTANHAFLTPQKAFDVIQSLDFNNFTITLQILDGTYTAASWPYNIQSLTGGGMLIISGNPNNWGAAVLHGETNHALWINNTGSTYVVVQYLQLINSATGDCLHASNSSWVNIRGLVFGSCAWSHIGAYYNAHVRVLASYSIIGSAEVHISSWIGGNVKFDPDVTVNLFNTPHWGTAFVVSSFGYLRAWGVTFNGSATGARYIANQNGVVSTNYAGANYLPGNSAGYAYDGGVYD